MTRLINHSESEVDCWLPEVPFCEAPPYPRVWPKGPDVCLSISPFTEQNVLYKNEGWPDGSALWHMCNRFIR